MDKLSFLISIIVLIVISVLAVLFLVDSATHHCNSDADCRWASSVNSLLSDCVNINYASGEQPVIYDIGCECDENIHRCIIPSGGAF